MRDAHVELHGNGQIVSSSKGASECAAPSSSRGLKTPAVVCTEILIGSVCESSSVILDGFFVERSRSRCWPTGTVEERLEEVE